MFSLSKIKNKKSFYLPIILFSALSGQCYGMEPIIKDVVNNLGSKDNPIHIITSDGKDSMYMKIAWAVGPTLGGIALTHLLNKWNEDPEINNLNKEEKKIELELKKHPDYSAINLLHQKNNEEKKANKNTQTHLTLEVQRAQLIEHHQENMNKFLQCAEQGSSEIERNYCKDMYKRHNDLVKQLFPTKS